MDADFIVNFPGLGINDLPINRVAFSVFGVAIYWYGLIITFGVLLCLILAYREAPKFKVDQEFLLDNFIVIIFSSLIGARLYYVAFSWDEFKDDLVSILDTRQGGMAFYGGVIAAVISIYILHKVKKKKMIEFLDFVAVYLPLGQAVGRWGNFVNQEAFGENTSLPWGMISNGTTNYLNAHPELAQNPNLPVHPTFLYEAIGNIILFAIMHRYRKNNKHAGSVVALYMIGYGLIRFFLEGIRTDSLYIGHTNIRVSQALSLLIFLLGLIYFFITIRKLKLSEAETEDKIFEKAKSDLDVDDKTEKGQSESDNNEDEDNVEDEKIKSNPENDELEIKTDVEDDVELSDN